MKQVVVLRHADWDNVTDQLTEAGREQCANLAPNIGPFTIVVSSPTVRTQQTAELLSGARSTADNRAGVLQAPPEYGPLIAERRKTDSFGVAGAIISIPELREPLKAQGQALKGLVQETLARLDDGQRALIVSHDGTMVALEKLLTGEPFDQIDHTYGTLEGYTLDESMRITRL